MNKKNPLMTVMTKGGQLSAVEIFDDESRMMRTSIWMWLALGVIFFFYS